MSTKSVKASPDTNPIRRLLHAVFVFAGSAGLTLVFFLVLPMMQVIGHSPADTLIVQTVDVADLPPPPPPPPEEEKKEEEPEEEPPELTEESPPLDLSQLELALNPGMAGDWGGADFAVKLNTVAADSKSVDSLFSIADLDQRPRAIFQPNPVLNAQLQRKTPATVNIIFVVDERGRVENPIIQGSTDPAFEAIALAAVKQWRFEPGKRNGQAVRFRMRVPITFPKGS